MSWSISHCGGFYGNKQINCIIMCLFFQVMIGLRVQIHFPFGVEKSENESAHCQFSAFTDSYHFLGIFWNPKDHHISSARVGNFSMPVTEENYRSKEGINLKKHFWRVKRTILALQMKMPTMTMFLRRR